MNFKIEKVEKQNIKELASLAYAIWHEYWTCILSPEQIDYMVEKFQSEHAINKQIENENYTYYFIIQDGQKAGYFGISDKKDYLFLSKLYDTLLFLCRETQEKTPLCQKRSGVFGQKNNVFSPISHLREEDCLRRGGAVPLPEPL